MRCFLLPGQTPRSLDFAGLSDERLTSGCSAFWTLRHEAGRKSVIPSAILGRYAKSLAEIVFEDNIDETVTGDLKTYSEIFHAVPDLLDALDSPAIPRDTKEKLLDELTARYPVHPTTFNFLRILLQNNRIRYFQEILDSFIKAVNEHKGIVSAQVTAAAPLSQQEVKSLEDRLADITGKINK